MEAIRDFPQPDSLRKFRAFLRLANFYRRFINNCAQNIQPLTDLLRSPKGPISPVEYNSIAEETFRTAKQALAGTAILVYLRPDAPTRIMVDASDVTVGAKLQEYNHTD